MRAKRRWWGGVMAVALAAAAWPALTARAQTPTALPVVVLGQVVDAVTGAPIAGAVVDLNTSARNSVERKVESGPDGRFAFDNVSQGKYYMFASTPGFFTAGLNDESQHGMSDELVVGWPGPPFITLKLRRHSAFAGVVVDDLEKPVAGARVTVLQRQPAWRSWGRRMIWGPVLNATATVTDAQGHYVTDALDSGDYLIGVDAGHVAIPGTPPMTFGTTYAPGVRAIAQAVSMALGTGERRVADVRIDRLPAFDLSGDIVVPGGDANKSFVQLVAVEEDEERARPEIERRATTGPSFTFSRLPPGDYLIVAQASGEFWTERRITISDHSLTDVQVVLAPTFRVSGRVVWEGLDRPPSRDGLRRDVPVHYEFPPSPQEIEFFAKLRAEAPVGLAGIVHIGRSWLIGTTVGASGPAWSADGTFTMRVRPGRILAEDAGLGGWFLKSFRINGREATEEPVEIASDSTGAVLTLTRDIGQVQGTIVSPSGSPDRASMAVLFSTNPRVWPGIAARRGPHLLMECCDGTDRFRFPNVLPGEYYLAAIEPIEWDRVDEDMLRRWAASAIRVQVPPGAPIVRTLTRVR